MKIAAIEPLNDGITPELASDMWERIVGFAGYAFNLSHSVEYTLISYQSAWLKTKYPVEFFAAAMSLMDEDKLPALIKDATRFGIDLSMPDINISTDRFEIATAVRLVIPFHRIKGLASRTTQAILDARKAGPFASKMDFINRVEKRACNISHQEALDKVGAFARIEPGQAPANDPSRVRDQLELLPGLITATVPINRDMENDKDTRFDIEKLVAEYRRAHNDTTGDGDGACVAPFHGRNARFMIVTDAPNAEEERNGVIGQTKAAGAIHDALAEHMMGEHDAYWTALIKRPKSDRQVTPEEIRRYAPWLLKEIKTLKPTAVVLLGTSSIRYFFPDQKGKAYDMAGKIIYEKEMDCNFVLGFSPGEIYYAPEKQATLNDVFAKVVDLLP